MTAPIWTPGDCPVAYVHAAYGPLLCNDPDHPNGETDHAHFLGMVDNDRGWVEWTENDPTCYRVDRRDHDPCPGCGDCLNTLAWRPSQCDGLSLLHDAWCPCNPPRKMVGVGSIIVDPQAHLHVVLGIEERDGPIGRVFLSNRTGLGRGIPESYVTRDGDWFVRRHVPPAADR